MEMQIELTAENPTGGVDYFYAPLSLPTTDAAVRDAMQRARNFGRKDGYQDITVTVCPLLPLLEETRLQAPTIRELHCFAARLEGLPEHEQLILEAVFKEQKNQGLYDDGITMKDLINLTYGLDSVPIASNVSNDEQLGELVIHSGMNQDVDSVPENALYLLDESRIGRFQRENDGGVFLNGTYIAAGDYEMPEVYDGIHLPGEPASMPGAFRLQIAKGPFDERKIPVYATGNPSDKSIWISLPIDREDADGAARELGESRIEDCVFYGFESAIPQIGSGKFGNMLNYETLNQIAARFTGMMEADQIKYKAVLQSQVFQKRENTLAGALDAARHIDEYELAYYCDDKADFAKMYLTHHLSTEFDTGWLNTIYTPNMGTELLGRLGACSTEYGIVSARGKSLYQLVPYEEPQEQEMTMEESQNTDFTQQEGGPRL